MELTLPKPLDQRLSPKDAVLHLAIGLFVTEEATLGQTAQTAGLSQADFLRELGRRRIPLHYGAEEPEADLQTVARGHLLDVAQRFRQARARDHAVLHVVGGRKAADGAEGVFAALPQQVALAVVAGHADFARAAQLADFVHVHRLRFDLLAA